MVCDDTNCIEATSLTAAQVPTTTALLYDDVPTPTIPITITTFCGGGEITRTFDVSDSFIVGDVGLGFNALHPNRDEIVVDLISPAGTRTRLIEPSGTMYGFANYDVWLSDAATQPLHMAIDDNVDEPYFDRAAQPDSPLSVFNGEAADGVWQLRICDLNPLTEGGVYNRSRLSLSPQGATLDSGHVGLCSADVHHGRQSHADAIDLWIGRRGQSHRRCDQFDLSTGCGAAGLDGHTVMTQTTQTSPTVVLAGQVTDGGGLNGVYVRVDPPEGASYRDSVDLTGTDWTYTPRPTVPGTYTFWLEAFDLAGNVRTSEPYEVQISTVNEVYLPIVMRNWVSVIESNWVYLPLIMR